MSSPYTEYKWQASDTLWRVAGTYLDYCGFTDTGTFADQIRQANSTILDWRRVPAVDSQGHPTVVYLPHAQG